MFYFFKFIVCLSLPPLYFPVHIIILSHPVLFAVLSVIFSNICPRAHSHKLVEIARLLVSVLSLGSVVLEYRKQVLLCSHGSCIGIQVK